MPSIFIYKYRISHSSEIIIIYLHSEFSQNFNLMAKWPQQTFGNQSEWLACSNLWSKLDRDCLGQVASHRGCAINLQCVIIFNQTESRGWTVLQPLGNQMFATTICNVITQQSTIFPSFKDVAVFFFTLMKPRHKMRYENTLVTNRESIHQSIHVSLIQGCSWVGIYPSCHRLIGDT